MTAAALVLGLAGYAAQGVPGLAGASPKTNDIAPVDAAAEARAHPLTPAYTRDDMTIQTVAAMLRAHNTRGAVALLNGELAGTPNSAPLWTALGQALIAHTDGQLTPAAQFALDRATQLRPGDPLPQIIAASTLERAGRIEDAAAVWQSIMAHMPAGAEGRADIARHILTLKAAR